jgi:hypothetical protein
MSWLFSRALVEAYSEAVCWDGAPSAPLSVMPTPHRFLRLDKTMEPSNLSRFGLTCAVLTADHGAALLTWYLAVFPARTSAPQAREPESRVSDPDCGWKWPESSVKYDPASRSWKTRQCSLLGGLDEFSETWPLWGSMRDGECWARPTLAPRISATGYGLWPTPTATLGTKGGRITPRKGREGGTLIEAVSHRMFPTPCATDWKTGYRIDTEAGKAQREARSKPLRDHSAPGGQLNPTWVEWLMGWPLGWTDLGGLEKDKSHNAP